MPSEFHLSQRTVDSLIGIKLEPCPEGARHVGNVTRHLKIQLTLLATAAGGRKGPIIPGEFRTVLSASGRNFSASLFLEALAVPGGNAVNCDVTLLDPTRALSYFPAGAQFELWEGGRKGYGFVLARHR